MLIIISLTFEKAMDIVTILLTMRGFLRYYKNSHGAVAQLVERMNGIHEATGSIPVSSTSYCYGS